MNQKHYQNIYLANVNVNLMVENVTQVTGGIMINVGLSVKTWENIMCAKKIISYGILLHVLAKMVNIWKAFLPI